MNRQLVVEADFFARDLAKYMRENPKVAEQVMSITMTDNPLDMLDGPSLDLTAEGEKLTRRLEALSEQTTGPYECIRLGILLSVLIGKHMQVPEVAPEPIVLDPSLIDAEFEND